MLPFMVTDHRNGLTDLFTTLVWFGYVTFALPLAIILCWVDRYFDSWVLLGLFRLL